MIDCTDLFIDGPAGRLSIRQKGMAESPDRVVILVQGSNLTGQSMFDFSFPGGDDYSLMNAVVGMGFGAVTFAVRGYGLSDPPDDPFTVGTEAAMEDLSCVVDWVRTQGFEAPHLLAFSWGGHIAGRYAEDSADKIGRLILYDPARGGGGLVLPAPTDPWWGNSPAHYEEKLEPEFTDPALRKALGEHVRQNEPRSPNGIRLENATYVTPVDPEKITTPTLMVYGEEAAKASYMKGGMERSEFFEKLATPDKAFVILPGAGDFAHFQKARFRLYKVISGFLSPE